MIQYRADGTVYCQDEADANRSLVVAAGPQATQAAAIAAFFAGSAYAAPVDPFVALVARVSAVEASSAVIMPGTYTIGSIAAPGTLPTPDATNLGKYAVVSDLYGDVTDKMLCRKVGTSYYWQPLRSLVRSMATPANGTNIGALTNPPVMVLTGSSLTTRTITMSAVGAYPGAEQDFIFTGTLGALQTLTIAGLAAGATLGLLTGTHKRVGYDQTLGWVDISG